MAGTDLQELPVFSLMPDERREFHKIRPASHTLLSVNCLYQMNAEKRKGVFTKLGQLRPPAHLADGRATFFHNGFRD